MVVERGTTGTGAVLCLSAVGKQNLYLENSNDSLFDYKAIKHGNFTCFHTGHLRERDYQKPMWPLGETVKFKIDPKTSGDILMRTFLKVTLPGLVAGKNYCTDLGHALIKEYSFKIDSQTIETIPMDWNIIHEEIFSDESERRCFKYIVSNGQRYKNTNSIQSQDPVDLYIPLYFFFNRSKITENGKYFHPYFYTCACTAQDIEISIAFNDLSFFSDAADLSDVVGDVITDRLTLMTEEATVTEEERIYYRNTAPTVVYTTVYKHPIETIPQNGPQIKNYLVGSKPVKSFHWFFRKNKFFIDPSEYDNRFNFSSTDRGPGSNAEDEDDNPIMKSAEIYLNGHKQMGFKDKTTDNNYFKNAVNLIHDVNSPHRNIYSYFFSMLPKSHEPSGSIDMSTISHTKSFIQCDVNPTADDKVNMYLFSLCYMVLKYEKDHCGLVFI